MKADDLRLVGGTRALAVAELVDSCDSAPASQTAAGAGVTASASAGAGTTADSTGAAGSPAGSIGVDAGARGFSSATGWTAGVGAGASGASAATTGSSALIDCAAGSSAFTAGSAAASVGASASSAATAHEKQHTRQLGKTGFQSATTRLTLHLGVVVLCHGRLPGRVPDRVRVPGPLGLHRRAVARLSWVVGEGGGCLPRSLARSSRRARLLGWRLLSLEVGPAGVAVLELGSAGRLLRLVLWERGYTSSQW